MPHNFIGAVIALVLGICVGIVNHLISSAVMKKCPKYLATVSVLRQVIHVGFLVALYFVGQNTRAGSMPLLIGGVIGITASMIISTLKLVGQNDRRIREKTEEESE